MRTTAVFVGAPVTRMASSRSSASISSVVLMHKESHISYASVKSLLRASPRLLTRPKSIEKRGVCGIRVLTGAHQIRDGPRICRIFKHLNLVPTWSLGLPRSDLSLEGDQQGARPLFENKGLDTIVLTLRDDAVGAPSPNLDGPGSVEGRCFAPRTPKVVPSTDLGPNWCGFSEGHKLQICTCNRI
jgi:hypothetical protein